MEELAARPYARGSAARHWPSSLSQRSPPGTSRVVGRWQFRAAVRRPAPVAIPGSPVLPRTTPPGTPLRLSRPRGQFSEQPAPPQRCSRAIAVLRALSPDSRLPENGGATCPRGWACSASASPAGLRSFAWTDRSDPIGPEAVGAAASEAEVLARLENREEGFRNTAPTDRAGPAVQRNAPRLSPREPARMLEPDLTVEGFDRSSTALKGSGPLHARPRSVTAVEVVDPVQKELGKEREVELLRVGEHAAVALEPRRSLELDPHVATGLSRGVERWKATPAAPARRPKTPPQLRKRLPDCGKDRLVDSRPMLPDHDHGKPQRLPPGARNEHAVRRRAGTCLEEAVIEAGLRRAFGTTGRATIWRARREPCPEESPHDGPGRPFRIGAQAIECGVEADPLHGVRMPCPMPRRTRPGRAAEPGWSRRGSRQHGEAKAPQRRARRGPGCRRRHRRGVRLGSHGPRRHSRSSTIREPTREEAAQAIP